MACHVDHGQEEMMRVLYLSKVDSVTKSACATAWPPLLATGTPTAGTRLTSSKLPTTTRSGGRARQVTYHGRPLYIDAGDTQPRDVNGAVLPRSAPPGSRSRARR
jgi:predicted lipoprotein with Yx(FWY)xxD motif